MNQPARAIISDIHANVEALQAVLADIQSQNIDQIYCLGDVVGYGPNPCECVDISMGFDLTLLGNHDFGALFDPEGFSMGAESAVFWTRSQLECGQNGSKDRWRYLVGRARTRREDSMFFVHGSPRSPLNEYVFPEDVYNQRKMQRIFSFVDRVCFQGHTHVPGIFTEDNQFHTPAQVGNEYQIGSRKVMINVGSVGQPRDENPDSCYVILHGDRVQFRRVKYDVETTRDKIYDIRDLDNFLGDRLVQGR